jgi:hypothetical protein
MNNWPTSTYYYDQASSSCFSYNQPAIGICFDIEKVGQEKHGLKCWEILWEAVEPRQIAGSSLFEGSLLESENVYCLVIQNHEPMRLGYAVKALETDADFLDVCASRPFFEGGDVLRAPLVAAGQIDRTGNLIGISYNARNALNQVKRGRAAAAQADAVINALAQATVPAQSKKWWHLWKP